MKTRRVTISDAALIKIPIKDNGEKLVNIKNICPEIVIALNPESRKRQRLPKAICYVRESVARRLRKAQRALPNGYYLSIRDGHRSLRIQKKIYNEYYSTLKKQHPNWANEKLKRMTDTFVAPVEIVPPHSTGGVVDLTVTESGGNELDMGTAVDTFTKKSYTYTRGLSSRARENRALLIHAMEKGGFVNYPPEWWHWSFGDRYWAAALKKKYAIYSAL